MKKEREIHNVLKNGERLKSCHYAVCYIQNKHGYPRLGISVSRKVGNAVVRNYCKRICREVFRKNKADLKGYDFFVIVKSIPDFKEEIEVKDKKSKNIKKMKELFLELEQIFNNFKTRDLVL